MSTLALATAIGGTALLWPSTTQVAKRAPVTLTPPSPTEVPPALSRAWSASNPGIFLSPRRPCHGPSLTGILQPGRRTPYDPFNLQSGSGMPGFESLAISFDTLWHSTQGGSCATYPAIVSQPGDYVADGVNFSTLLTNEEFVDATSLSVDEIQKLLEESGSFLADFGHDGRSAARIISDAATENAINPRLILATLQKENGLLSRPEAPPSEVMRAAMGYGCDDAGGSAGSDSNFCSQVEQGARALSSLYKAGQRKTFPLQMNVDYGERSLLVNNAATYALFKYTPHTRDTHLERIGGGNHLFKKVMHRVDLLALQLATRTAPLVHPFHQACVLVARTPIHGNGAERPCD